MAERIDGRCFFLNYQGLGLVAENNIRLGMLLYFKNSFKSKVSPLCFIKVTF